MILPKGRGPFLAATLYHEYAHHVDSHLRVRGLPEANGSERWLAARDLAARIALPGYRARVDRAAVLRLTGFDWNCPQHIPQRFTLDELGDALAPVRARMAALEEENRALRARLGEA